MRHLRLWAWMGLFGGVLVVGCSLNGLVFDRDGAGGAGGASSSSGGTGGGGGSDIAVDAGVEAGAMLPPCVDGEIPPSGDGEINCNDGKDNDKNGQADCADANCAALGFKCFATPSGWSGMGVFYESKPDSLACCPRDYIAVGVSGGREPSGAPVTCSSCGCTAQAVQCQPSPILADADALCSTGMTSIPQASDQCQQVVGMASFTAKAPTVTVTDCAITGGAVSATPEFTWAVADRVCVAANQENKSCGGAGHFCARPAPGAHLCIWRNEPSDCPSEFPKKSTFFRGVNDTRGCAACGCGLPEGKASCSVATSLYSTVDCTGATDLGPVPNDSTCVAKVGVQSIQTIVSTVNPTCPPSGGGPIGQVVTNLDSETTVCCPE